MCYILKLDISLSRINYSLFKGGSLAVSGPQPAQAKEKTELKQNSSFQLISNFLRELYNPSVETCNLILDTDSNKLKDVGHFSLLKEEEVNVVLLCDSWHAKIYFVMLLNHTGIISSVLNVPEL